ncbi:MAG: OmpA family protein [Saprospiraceae bacterium]|nr:OmpA family protein [Saprospiraceae bacterium]
MKKMKIWMLPMLLLLFMTSCVSTKKFNALQSEKDELAANMAKIEQKVSMLEEENTKLNSEKATLDQNISQVRTQLSSTETQLKDVEKNLNDKQAQINQIRSAMDEAFTNVEDAVLESNQRLVELEDMLYVDMDDPINFKTGSAVVSKDDQETLDKIATMLKANPNMHFIVEGHADKRSIHTDKYQDNWDLSAARSIEVVRKLIKMGVDPKQLTAAGRAEFMPTAEGSDPESLAKNRRTEIIVVPNIGKLYEMHKNKTIDPKS